MAKSKSIYLGFGTRIIILIMLIVFGLVMSGNFFIRATAKNSKSVSVMSSANIDYKVHLKENSYYETNILPSDMKYIASLIDYIDTNIAYKITSTDVLNYNYSYYIDAVTKVYGDNAKTKVLFEKTNTILDKKELTANKTGEVAINENVKIDYNEYNTLVSAFKTSYALTSVSDVSIVLHVVANAKSEEINKTVNINENSELVIPLTEQTIDVQMTKNPGHTYSVMDSVEKLVISSKKDLVLSIAFLVCTLGIIIRLIKLLSFTSKNDNSNYLKVLKRILKENDLIIANVKHDINEDDYEVVNVESFNELKDIHDNIGNPILFTEIHKNQKSSFVIVKDNFLYKYILKATDVKKK